MRIATAVMFGLLLILAACSSSTEPAKESELYKVPTSIILGGESFELTAFLWRDFQPISPPEGKPLAVVVSLPERLGDVRVEQLWALFGNQVWKPDVDQIPGTRDWRADGGPNWEPGVSVDVVAQLRDRSGKEFLVRAPDRPIERAD